MNEDILVKHGSPTLAGIKTGALFSCVFDSVDTMRRCIREWNRIVVKKGLRVLPLQCRNLRVLVYIYRISHLRRDFQRADIRSILTRMGYCCDNPEACILNLVKRLDADSGFPHEIGLFLGYPPEDVMGFIKHNACGFKCVGCWKVYGDEKAAREQFVKYRRCTEAYCTQYAKGTSVERLTVAG